MALEPVGSDVISSEVKRSFSIYEVTISLILLVSVAANVALVVRYSRLSRRVQSTPAAPISLGVTVPNFSATSAATGIREPLNFASDGQTVLYVFTPTCPWCRKNLPNVRALLKNSPGRYSLVGISLSSDGLRDYVAAEHLDFPVYYNVPQDIIQNLGLGGTPETLVIDRNRRVSKVWMGAYIGEESDEIGNYLGIKLPGCCESPTNATIQN